MRSLVAGAGARHSMRRSDHLPDAAGEDKASGRGLGEASAERRNRGQGIGIVGAAHRREGILVAGCSELGAGRILAAAAADAIMYFSNLFEIGDQATYCIV